MASWDDEEEFEAPNKAIPLLKGEWDDEDADLNDVKDSWDEEEQPVVEQPVKAPKPAAKAAEKDKKGKAPVIEDVLDPLEEKLRQQRLVEEADFKSTTELFKGGGEKKDLDTFIPKTPKDFQEYGEMIAQRLRRFEKSFHYMNLLKDVMRLSMASLNAADAKEVSSAVSAIANEKIKAEKEANKKKAGGKKKQLNAGKDDDKIIAGGYDEALDDDEYDFM